MPTPDPHEFHFNSVRVRYGSTKSYEELVAALFADVGERPYPVNDFAATTRDWQSYEDLVQPNLGPSGFMLVGLFDHGAWITKAGVGRKVLRVVIGNPIVAISMLRHDVTAGLFVPVELLLVNEDAGRSSLTYIKPSSLMVVDEEPELLTAAEQLDAMVAALAVKITSG
jgi:uncharacterized protein (DUF302 family)